MGEGRTEFEQLTEKERKIKYYFVVLDHQRPL